MRESISSPMSNNKMDLSTDKRLPSTSVHFVVENQRISG